MAICGLSTTAAAASGSFCCRIVSAEVSARFPYISFFFYKLCHISEQGEIPRCTCIAKRAFPDPLTQKWLRITKNNAHMYICLNPKKKCFQIFCTGEINPFSFAEQIVQPGKCGTYCWRIILGDFLQRQYHTFCPCATLLLSTREAGQLFSAFCNLKYLS